MEIDKDDNKSYLLYSSEKILDEEADCESTKSDESLSDFEVD